VADPAYIESELNALPPDVRVVMVRVFRDFLRDLRFGHSTGTPPDPATNFGAGFFTATTPAVANTEFTITHTFGRAPYLALPVLRLDAIGSQIARLMVTRAADADFLYLSSPDVNVPVTLVVEG
jgi:hypothetical protein